MMSKEKICSGCEESKSLDEFYKASDRKEGRRSTCKICDLDKCRKYRRTHKDEIKVFSKRFRDNHREQRRKEGREYYQNNKDKRRDYERAKRKSDPIFNLRKKLKNQIWRALKRQDLTKTKSCMEYVNYTIQELHNHLELQGYYLLEDPSIDHIIGQSLFDFTDESEIRKCWDLRNLRALDLNENIRKGSKLDVGLIKLYGIEDLLPTGVII